LECGHHSWGEPEWLAYLRFLHSYNAGMVLAIRVRGLVKTYPGRPSVKAVRGLDLDVFPGECFGLLGPNGAGKTTTLDIIEGLHDPTAGDVEVLGLKWGDNDIEIRRKIGISLQDTRLSDKLTVRETVTLFRSFYSSGPTPDEAIGAVSLEEKARSYVDKLSGGQKQRLAVATALVGDPDLLFLDEPTTGLDPQSRPNSGTLFVACTLAGKRSSSPRTTWTRPNGSATELQ